MDEAGAMKDLLYEQYHEYMNRPVSERKPVCCFAGMVAALKVTPKVREIGENVSAPILPDSLGIT